MRVSVISLTACSKLPRKEMSVRWTDSHSAWDHGCRIHSVCSSEMDLMVMLHSSTQLWLCIKNKGWSTGDFLYGVIISRKTLHSNSLCPVLGGASYDRVCDITARWLNSDTWSSANKELCEVCPEPSSQETSSSILCILRCSQANPSPVLFVNLKVTPLRGI